MSSRRRNPIRNLREWGLVVLFIAMLVLCIVGFNQSPTPNTQATQASSHPQLGMNLGQVVSYTSQWPFVDAMKLSRPWISGREGAAFGEGGPLKLTPEGWIASLEPEQFAETIMFDNGQGHYPAGRYTLLYEGEGEMSFTFDSAKIVNQQPGRMLLDVTPMDTGIWLKISQTNPQNPIRNLRLILPGLEKAASQQLFHPLFLERLQPFKTLRFMNWMETNGSELQEWGDRPQVTDATQASQGVALEYLIDLANTLQANPWFTLPHKASDDYVRQFAAMVRDRLDPGLKIYVEYSNEVWNGAPDFSQHQYAQAQGLALGLSDDPYQASLRYYSQRSVEVFKIWESVFGGRDRMVRVLAAQYANPWTAEQVLNWKDAYKSADAYAIAPYFSGEWDYLENLPRLLKSSEAEIWQKMEEEIQSYGPYIRENYARIRDEFGLDLIAYEGGQHLTSAAFGEEHEEKITQLFTSLNRHPRMATLYTLYLNQWKEVGGGLFCHFVDVTPYTRFGSWGALEYQDQPLETAPKYRALVDFIQSDAVQ